MTANTPTHKQQQDLPPAAALSSLRDLLLGDEKVELGRVSADLDALKRKLGDQEKFRQAVAEVLADALTDARTHDQVRLARALSPIVASSIKREIANSKDEMVEALYPITGRLVAASVRNSITKLGEDINLRLERMFSFRGMLTRWRTQLTGGNTADLMLADTQKAEIQRAMIIERGSGILLGQWHNEGENQEGRPESDMDLISGLLSAISSLADEAFGGENAELRTLDLNGSQVALRRSPKHIVALEFTGMLSADDRLKLDAAFAECIERLLQDDDAEAFTPFMSLSDEDSTGENAATDATPKEPFGIKSLAKIALGIGMVLLIGFGMVQWWANRNLDIDIGKIEAVLNAESALDGFPIIVKPDGSGNLSVDGLYPMRFNIDGFRQRLQHAVGDRAMIFDMRPVADATDIEALQREIFDLKSSLSKKGAKP